MAGQTACTWSMTLAIIIASRFIRIWNFMLTRGGRNTETGSVPRPLENGPLDRLRLQG